MHGCTVTGTYVIVLMWYKSDRVNTTNRLKKNQQTDWQHSTNPDIGTNNEDNPQIR